MCSNFCRVLPSGTHQLADSEDYDHDDDGSKKDKDEEDKNVSKDLLLSDDSGTKGEDGTEDGVDVNHAAFDIFCNTSSEKVKSPRLSEDSELSDKCFESQQQVLDLSAFE